MNINDVDMKATRMKPKTVNEKNHPLKHQSQLKPLIIADLKFLFSLFRQFPDPFPERICPALHLPDVLAQSLPPSVLAKLQPWKQNGNISVLETGDALFEQALRISVSAGMLITDYVVILAALHNKQSIITSTKIITGEATRMKVQVTDSNMLLQSIGKGRAINVVNKKRVGKNKIIPTGVSALIAGNFNKCSI
jgi:hypothetical protein